MPRVGRLVRVEVVSEAAGSLQWLTDMKPVVKLLHTWHGLGRIVGDVLHVTSLDMPFERHLAAAHQDFDLAGI